MDDDGLHIASLILGFIYRHAKPILDAGYMYIAMPPLYSIIERNKKRYFLNKEEYDAYINEKIFENYTFTVNDKSVSKQTVLKLLQKFDTYNTLLNKLAIDNSLNKYLIDDICVFLRENSTATSKDIMAYLKSIGDFEVFKNENNQTEINGLYKDGFVNAIVKDLVKTAKKAINILDDLKIPTNMCINFDKISVMSYENMYQQVTPKSRSRFKGLGEMDAEELWETTLNPDVRNIMQVVLSDDEKTDDTMDTLLNSNSKYADKRKVFLMKNQQKVIELEI